jgi:hypothetical protein
MNNAASILETPVFYGVSAGVDAAFGDDVMFKA